ncbi:MAG: uracil-DNA glycosylase, partial [Methanothrix sp.]|nr:uracil-DNA glycosylase [Methanothrix sp.]
DEAGLDRSGVFITSAVKCRPPGNRQPSHNEVEACRPYLVAQISLIDPRVVCLMGNVAAYTILGVRGIGSLRGRLFDGRFLPTYHPAAVLRDRRLMEGFVSDLRAAKRAASRI